MVRTLVRTDTAVRAAQWTGLGTVVAALIAAAVSLIASCNAKDASSDAQKVNATLQDILLQKNLVGVKAESYLRLDDSLKSGKSMPNAAVHVFGTLKKDLPSAVQIWTGSQKVQDPNYNQDPTDAFGVDWGGPCKINSTDNTFDCGDVNIGDNRNVGTSNPLLEKGYFAIFVGVATSDGARGLTERIRRGICGETLPSPSVPGAQVCKQENEGPLPGNVVWLTPVVQHRL